MSVLIKASLFHHTKLEDLWQIGTDPYTGEATREYFSRNTAIPFLDNIVSDFERQFLAMSVKASRLLGLILSVICNEDVQ